ncbi:MAG: hypothetical protein SPI63_04970 [Bulleidia sp.]|nr:hypothetical protein [Bulleidia sp.]
MLKINQIRCELGDTFSIQHIAKKLHCKPSDILFYEIDRMSMDARGNDFHYVYSVYADVVNENKFLHLHDVKREEKQLYQLPVVHTQPNKRPIVVGFGPSGMYAALILAEAGLNPIIIERGQSVEQRTKDIHEFFTQGKLLPESNVQFGEGGAGTFSDGKLTTRMKNIRVTKVYEEFVEAGANPSIMYEQRPHLGTDVLQTIVKKIREKIIRFGGEIHFNTKLESLYIKDNQVVGIHTTDQDFDTDCVLLCAGHSASDTYENLLAQGVEIVQKDFAIGVRVEHPQSLIDQSTYRKYYGHPSLHAASYQLTAKTSVNRGVYSFCMCPGGVVIPASTQENTLAVNGMSYSNRAGKNANSAILVQIPRSDFDKGHPLDGFEFQKQLEQKCFKQEYLAPVQNIKDYLQHQTSSSLVVSSSYPRPTYMTDMHAFFSDEVNQAMEEGMKQFDTKIHGWIDNGIMVGLESRSSSPIRIVRNECGNSTSIRGLYPCGEGAGYAGGIVSSAVDGIKQAENYIQSLNKKM